MNATRNRRGVLKAAGISLTLPLLESLMPRNAVAGPGHASAKRMAIVTVPFGMVVDKFHPAVSGVGYEFPETLQSLRELRNDFTVFSNLDHDVRGGHAANHTLLSGVKSTERAEYPDGNVTVDQRAAELVGHNTRFPSLVFWKDGMNFTRTGVRVPAIAKPSDAFELMFVDDSDERKKFNRASVESSGSILDAILEDARGLKRELGKTDQQKLEEYFSSIRETEKKLALAEDWIDKPKPRVADPEMKKVENGSCDTKIGDNLVEVWLDLMFLALQTDSTRVVSMAVENGSWGLDGVTDSYHTLSHHGQRKDALSQLAIIERHLIANLGRFIGRLKSTIQPGGASLLDTTQVLFGSGLGSGSRHSNDNLPLILAGGGWKHGMHIDAQRGQPLCNLYLSMLQRMGTEQDRFNRSLSTFTGLST
ncbi:MAG: DUF1552 domain-containing protein [Fuerstiella sp.]|jgi:hypothetical protein|nr:DUF1552 domain-containing protein [Fuerstiella sp.]